MINEDDFLEKMSHFWQNADRVGMTHLYSQMLDHPECIPALLRSCLDTSEMQAPSMWLLKYYVEAGNVLELEHVDGFCGVLAHLHDWQSTLQALQVISFLSISVDQVSKVIPFVRLHTRTNRPFVRAWAVFAMAYLAKVDTTFQEEAELCCRDALETGSASVKVRARKALKLLERAP